MPIIVLFLEIQLIIALLLLLQDLANTAAQKPLNVEFSTVKFTIFPQSLPKSATSFLTETDIQLKI